MDPLIATEVLLTLTRAVFDFARTKNIPSKEVEATFKKVVDEVKVSNPDALTDPE